MQNKMIAKSMLIWITIIPLAIINGALREYILIPKLNKFAYPISGIILSLCIFIVAYIFIPLIGAGDRRIYVKMGFVWFISIIVFEFIMGIVMGTPLEEMLQAYNISTGNLWLAIVIFAGFVPYIIAKLKKII